LFIKPSRVSLEKILSGYEEASAPGAAFTYSALKSPYLLSIVETPKSTGAKRPSF